METLADALADRASGIALRELSDSALSKLGTCLLDFLAACADGAPTTLGRQAADTALATGGAGGCSILGTRFTTSSAEAAFASAVLGGCTAQMDTFAESASHPGVTIFPALFALAESRGDVTGAQFALSALAGYEVMGRLGRLLFQDASRFAARPTGVLGPIAAAAATARLRCLSADETSHAISIAANTSSGLMEWTKAGTTEFVFHSGFASRSGLTASEMAARGVVAARTTLDGEFGLRSLFATAGAAAAPSAPGEPLQIFDVVHKPAPACVFVQSPCQAAISITARRVFTIDDVKKVTIYVHPTASGYPGCDNAAVPRSPQEARMSIQFSVAAVLASRAIQAGNWLDPPRSAACALLSRCRLRPIEEASVAAHAGPRSCVVEVELASGELVREVRDDIRASTLEEMAARFGRSWQPALGSSRGARITGWARDLRGLRSVNELTGMLRSAAPDFHAAVG